MIYIWLDAQGNLRSVTLLVKHKLLVKKSDNSQCKILQLCTDTFVYPIKVFDDGSRAQICFCKRVPNKNTLLTLPPKVLDKQIFWQQSYLLCRADGQAIGFPPEGLPDPQIDFCNYVPAAGHDLAHEHAQQCIKFGINVRMLSSGPIPGGWRLCLAANCFWDLIANIVMARWLIAILASREGWMVNYKQKPFTNYSQRQDCLWKICSYTPLDYKLKGLADRYYQQDDIMFAEGIEAPDVDPYKILLPIAEKL